MVKLETITKYLASSFGFSNAHQATVTVTGGFLGTLVGYAFGGWSGMLEIFFLALVLDYITGCAASLKEKKGLHSEIGFWGLVKKVLMAVAVYYGHRADLAFDTNYIMYGLLTAFLANELISLAENYGRLGLPLGQHLEPIIAILKQKKGDMK